MSEEIRLILVRVARHHELDALRRVRVVLGAVHGGVVARGDTVEAIRVGLREILSKRPELEASCSTSRISGTHVKSLPQDTRDLFSGIFDFFYYKSIKKERTEVKCMII